MKKIICIFLLSMALFSCTKQDEILPANQNSSNQENSIKVLNYIKSLGISEKDIQEFADKYIVQEDIIFPKNMITPLSVSKSSGVKKQYYYSLVSFANQSNIRIKIASSMTSSPNMTSEIYSAIAKWNDLHSIGSKITLSIVTGSSYDIIISDGNLGDGFCGQGSFPSNGYVGSYIYINKNYIANNSYDQRVRTITHEIGHCIGFFHTNASGGIAVPGVGGTDASSLMNGGQCGTGATVLSVKDKNATVALYPTDAPYALYNSGNYPWNFYWTAPLYTGFGTLVGYEVKYNRIDHYGSSHVSTTTFQTATYYTLPFTYGQYPGESVILSVRSGFANGSFSSWSTYNCTL